LLSSVLTLTSRQIEKGADALNEYTVSGPSSATTTATVATTGSTSQLMSQAQMTAREDPFFQIGSLLDVPARKVIKPAKRKKTARK
jgi:hypothetical protein